MPLKSKLILLGILSFALISANIGGYSIYILDEAKNAGCALEMLNTGSFIVPTFNGELRTDKPPLHYYFMMAAYRIFGATPFAARFFSAVFGTLTILVTFAFTRRFLNERAASFTALALLSSFGFITQFHLATPDPYLIFFITLALITYFHFDHSGNKKYLYTAYASVGLGILAKGPVALVLPGMVVMFYILSLKKLTISYIRSLQPLLGIAITLGIASPWFILVHIKTGGAWTSDFFIGHNLERFAEPREGHGGSIALPTLFFLALLLPFTFYLSQIVSKTWRNRKLKIIRFCGISILSILAFFSLSGTKLPNYVAPALPFAAILIGFFLSQLYLTRQKTLIMGMVIFGIFGIASIWGISAFLSNHLILSSQDSLAWYFLPLPVAGICGGVLLILRKKTWAIIAISFGFIIMHQLFFYHVYPTVDQHNPVSRSLNLVRTSKDSIVYYKQINPAYIFSTKRSYTRLSNIREVNDFLKVHPETLVISHPKHLHELMEVSNLHILFQQQDLFDTNDVLILGSD